MLLLALVFFYPYIYSVRFKSVNSAHFYYTLIVVPGVETDILRNQSWYAVRMAQNLLSFLPADFSTYYYFYVVFVVVVVLLFFFISRAYRSKMETCVLVIVDFKQKKVRWK